jgi:RNA polymerase II-associated factor 1
MDARCYKEHKAPVSKLHPDDDALLNWTGSLGDTAAEQLKVKRDQARAAARLALKGKAPPAVVPTMNQPKKKKEFSRVLDESMQSWMKKTTYLSNDYSRKVHDFTSLAKTKQKTAEDLEAKQEQMVVHRSAESIEKTFETTPIFVHPSKPNLKPVMELPFLPNVEHWGHAYTHVVLDNPPKGEDATSLEEALDHSFVAHVEKRQLKLTCQLLVPRAEEAMEYRSIQTYDLDVFPLKEEDAPHVHFAVWVSDKEASYLPISSRVSLSTGRPAKQQATNVISRRAATLEDKREFEERTAEVDADLARKITDLPSTNPAGKATAASSYNPMQEDESSDDEQEGTFGASTTIVAEG